MSAAAAFPALERIAAERAAVLARVARRVVVCAGSGCMSAGAQGLREAFAAAIAAAGLPVATVLDHGAPPPAGATWVHHSGCQGFCQGGPLVTIEPEGLLYRRVCAADVPEIVAETLVAGRAVERLLHRGADGAPQPTRAGIPFFRGQARLLLQPVGDLDPEDVAASIHRGGYRQARRAWTAMEPAAVVAEIAAAGLRGRGGGGFPTARKWELARTRPPGPRVLICNADEGDPGAFMNRAVLMGDPHAVLEGMLIAAHAIGADRGLIYVRAEHRAVVARLRLAIADAGRVGVLGAAPFGVPRPFRVEVAEGASAFVCGEETALIASLEGRRGSPRPRPPWPAESGLNGLPTVVNNVETLAMAVQVLRQGAAAFRRTGTPGSSGTKILTLTGHLANTGLVEVPFGATVREIVFGIGGGAVEDGAPAAPAALKAVLLGGPSGGILPADRLDVPLDYEAVAAAGAMVGSGFLAAMDRRTCMVEVARFFAEFAAKETCGKCVPCREGARQLLALLERACAGQGAPDDLGLIEELAENMRHSSLCGLGRTAANPVVSALRGFREEFLAHVRDRRCPARRCKALCPPAVDAGRCKGCGACIRACPAGAVAGERKQPHRIDPGRCVRCGACVTACRFAAVA